MTIILLGGGATSLSVNNVKVSPDPVRAEIISSRACHSLTLLVQVVAGKNFTLSLDCSTSFWDFSLTAFTKPSSGDQVSDGTFVIQVYLAGIMVSHGPSRILVTHVSQVHKQTNGICEERSCPFGSLMSHPGFHWCCRFSALGPWFWWVPPTCPSSRRTEGEGENAWEVTLTRHDRYDVKVTGSLPDGWGDDNLACRSSGIEDARTDYNVDNDDSCWCW